MELKQIRMGIVGAGTWGATHASIYAEHICADPVAICDMNKEKAQAIADKYGIRKVYTDYKELAADPDRCSSNCYTGFCTCGHCLRNG